MAIGFQKTPGRPIEVLFTADLGVPNDNQELLLIGRAASGATGVETVVTVNAVSDVDGATAEANLKFGSGSELAKMVIAAVKANALASRGTFPVIKCVPLASTATTLTTAAQTAAKGVKAEFIVSPFDGQTDATARTALRDLCAEMSGPQRVENNQYGTIGVAANQSVTDPSTLTAPDSQFLSLVWFRNSAPTYSVGEVAAAYAAVLAGNITPFVPVDNYTVGGLAAPSLADQISVGAGLLSETCLTKGWTPLRTKPNGDVSIVRSVTTRITVDGTVAAGAYYDVQDFQVLYYWRKTVFTRLNQPDLKNVKASKETALIIEGELVRLANLFEQNQMFQAVAQLAKEFTVTRSLSDRHRFDVSTPVNVIPNLHVVATSVKATTRYDVLSI